jgi:hypothetical protein
MLNALGEFQKIVKSGNMGDSSEERALRRLASSSAESEQIPSLFNKNQ